LLEYVDQILLYASEKTTEFMDSPDLHSAAAQSNMLNLLLAPIKTYFSLFTALALPHYIPLFSSQTYFTRRSVSGEVARSILRNKIRISTSDHLEGVLSLLKVLIKEGVQQPSGYPGLGNRQRGGETDETLEEQGWLARIVHLVQADDNDVQLQVGLDIDHCDWDWLTPCSFSSNYGNHMMQVTNGSNTLHQH
jgi:vacuolar protein sorting-associated protein 35